MATITWSGGTITPTQIDGYQSSRKAGAVAHPILGTNRADLTLRPAGPRVGTLTLCFLDEAAAKACEDAHGTPSTFTLTEPARPSVAMVYAVVEGEIVRTLEDVTRNAWIVTVPFYEVVA